MPWPSLDVASRIADLANVFFIGSLVIGVVSTIAIVWMANVKEAHWDLARERSQERIAELNKETQRLSADAESSRAEISKANARANEAQLALEIFKQPRAISFGKEKQDRVSNKLKIFAGTKFDMGISTGDSEAVFFLSTIEGALRGAGLVQVDWVDTHANAIRLMRSNKPLVGGVSAFGGVIIEIDESKHPEFRGTVDAIALKKQMPPMPTLSIY